MAQKQFHIVKIINDSEFIINAGYDDTVVGEKFNIIGYANEEIIDPITKDSLGSIETSKGTITVTRVFEKMSIASAGVKYISPFVYQTMVKAPLNPLFNSLKQERVRLNVDLTQVSGASNYTDDPIQIGDEVVKVD